MPVKKTQTALYRVLAPYAYVHGRIIREGETVELPISWVDETVGNYRRVVRRGAGGEGLGDDETGAEDEDGFEDEGDGVVAAGGVTIDDLV